MFTAGNSSRLLTFYGLFRMLDNPVASLCLAEKFSSKNDILRANVELILFYTLHILASSDGEEESLPKNRKITCVHDFFRHNI